METAEEGAGGGLPKGLGEHLLRPRGLAEPPPGVAVARGRGENAACGDVLELRLWREAGRLRAGFRASACAGVMATASLLCELLEAAQDPNELDLRAALAERGGLPRQRAHSARVAERALEAALRGLGP